MSLILALPGVALLLVSYLLHQIAKRGEVELKKLDGKGTVGNVTYVEMKRRRRNGVVALHQWSLGLLFAGILAVALGAYGIPYLDL